MNDIELKGRQKKAFLKKYKDVIDIEKPENVKIFVIPSFSSYCFLGTVHKHVIYNIQIFRDNDENFIAIYPEEHVRKVATYGRSVFIELIYKYKEVIRWLA